MEEIKRIPEIIKNYPVIVAGASFWQPGLGQILCGRIKRGIILLIPVLIASLIYYSYNLAFYLEWLKIGPSNIIWSLYYLTQLMIQFFIRVWSTYDAYRIATRNF